MNLKTEPEADGGGGGGGNRAELRQIDPEEGRVTFGLKQQTNFVVGIGDHPVPFTNSNGEHSWRAKDYYVSRVLPSLDRCIESRRFISKSRFLTRISEEIDLETANDMMFAEHDQDSLFRQGSSSTNPRGPQYYGSGLGDASFDEDDDDYELLLDEGLARDGLYRGNYRHLLLLYTVVPLTTFLSFVCLALVPTLVFTTETPSLFPYPPYLPFPILEVLIATALWSLSYLLRDFLYATALFVASSLPATTIITTALSVTLQTISILFLRQIAIPILLIPYYSSKHLAQEYPTWQDDSFKRVWWVALGWAAAEAVVGVKQGYESIALYKDVLVSVNMPTLTTEMGTRGRSGQDELYSIANKRPETPQEQNEDEREDLDTTPRQTNWENQQQRLNRGLTSSPIQRARYSRSLSIGSDYVSTKDPPPTTNERQPLLRTSTQRAIDESQRLQAENDVERDLDQLIALKNREELEEVYGIPVIRIPVFISCLHRINSILSSLGVCLLLTAAYMQSTFAILTPPSSTPSLFKRDYTLSLHFPAASNRRLVLTTLPILIICILLALMHTPLILPRIGIHTFVYVELLISLGVFFGGLGVWDALS